MWLRMLGRGRVQQEAIAQLTALSVDNPLRSNALELLYNLQANLQANLATSPQADEEDRELIMAIAPLFQEQLQAAKQQGLQQGIQQGREEGIQQGIEQGLERGLERGIEQGLERGIEQGLERGRQEQQRLILENFFLVRFGQLEEKMTVFFSTLSTLPAAEFTMILLSISMLTVDEAGRQQAMRLLAENFLRMRGYELGDLLAIVMTNLLALPVEELRLLLDRSPHLSTNELINLLGESRE
jgi:hypothetical protein